MFKLVKNTKICGGQGDAFVGQVEVNRYARGYNAHGPKVDDNWVKIDKSYSIYVDELSQANPRLFDDDRCME